MHSPITGRRATRGGNELRQAVPQHRSGNDAGAGHVGADMPDAGDQKVADLATDHQPDVVGGDDGADQRAADVDGGQPQ